MTSAAETEPFRDADANPADLLYDKCAAAPEGTLFFQRDLTNMQVADTVDHLMILLQDLVGRHLLKFMTFENEACWQLRSKAEAEKLRKLTPDERLLYQYIDAAQNDGIWSKALKAKTNLTPQLLNKLLRSLESKDLVKAVMSVKAPNRKMYLLKHLRPSEDVAGGPWQTDGDFDKALIDAISNLVDRIIRMETCVEVPPNWNNYPASARDAVLAKKKAQFHRVPDIEDAPPIRVFRPPKASSRSKWVPKMLPSYPTASSILATIKSTGVLKENMVVQTQDMEQLLEMMVLDGRLEKVSGTSYRTAMDPANPESYNGFVDAPCGNCPVFHICGEEGEITATTCVYFGEWLETESEMLGV